MERIIIGREQAKRSEEKKMMTNNSEVWERSRV